jgi:hypothetical protein
MYTHIHTPRHHHRHDLRLHHHHTKKTQAGKGTQASASKEEVTGNKRGREDDSGHV